MTEKVCIYHISDLDGHCSGAIVNYIGANDVEMIGMDYGYQVPWDKLKDREVFMVDFSLEPWEDMVKLQSIAKRFVWIDHHKTAIERYEKHLADGGAEIDGVRDTKFAACELTWSFLIPRRPIPIGVQLLGRYDVWDHKSMTGVLEFQYGMRALVTDPAEYMEDWNVIFGETSREVDLASAARRFRSLVATKGDGILKYETVQNAKHAGILAFDLDFDGKRWIAVNAAFKNSQFFDSVFDSQKHDGMLMFYWHDGHWTVSLRSQSIDVGEIASRHGGGGHAGASGFHCSELPFELPVETKVTIEIPDDKSEDETVETPLPEKPATKETAAKKPTKKKGKKKRKAAKEE